MLRAPSSSGDQAWIFGVQGLSETVWLAPCARSYEPASGAREIGGVMPDDEARTRDDRSNLEGADRIQERPLDPQLGRLVTGDVHVASRRTRMPGQGRSGEAGVCRDDERVAVVAPTPVPGMPRSGRLNPEISGRAPDAAPCSDPAAGYERAQLSWAALPVAPSTSIREPRGADSVTLTQPPVSYQPTVSRPLTRRGWSGPARRVMVTAAADSLTDDTSQEESSPTSTGHCSTCTRTTFGPTTSWPAALLAPPMPERFQGMVSSLPSPLDPLM